MKKTLTFILSLLLLSNILGQTVTITGFVVAGGDASTTGLSNSFSIGQLFYQDVESTPLNKFNVLAGIQQAQILRDTINDTICAANDYAGYDWNIPASELSTFGPHTFDDDTYNPNQYTLSYQNYDSVTVLELFVAPHYEVYDTILLYADEVASYLHEGMSVTKGDNDLSYPIEHGCDSLVHLRVYAVPCPLDTFFHTMEHPGVSTYAVVMDTAAVTASDPFVSDPADGKVAITSSPLASAAYDFPVGDTSAVTYTASVAGHTLSCDRPVVINYFPCPATVDLDGYTYPVTRVLYDCWTKENLRNENYYDGTAISTVAEPMIFHTYYYPNETENLDNYGRLYTWAAATKNGAVTGSGNGEDYVRGICPEGWHLPTDTKFNEYLMYYNEEDLKSTSNLWLPQGGTDLSTFSALPGGFYNATHDAFEEIRMQAYFWTVTETGAPATRYSLLLNGSCGEQQLVKVNLLNGNSVRCLLDY